MKSFEQQSMFGSARIMLRFLRFASRRLGIENEWFCFVTGDSDVPRLQCAVDERDGLRRDALPPRVHVSHHSTSANMHELRRTG